MMLKGQASETTLRQRSKWSVLLLVVAAEDAEAAEAAEAVAEVSTSCSSLSLVMLILHRSKSVDVDLSIFYEKARKKNKMDEYQVGPPKRLFLMRLIISLLCVSLHA